MIKKKEGEKERARYIEKEILEEVVYTKIMTTKKLIGDRNFHFVSMHVYVVRLVIDIHVYKHPSTQVYIHLCVCR